MQLFWFLLFDYESVDGELWLRDLDGDGSLELLLIFSLLLFDSLWHQLWSSRRFTLVLCLLSWNVGNSGIALRKPLLVG